MQFFFLARDVFKEVNLKSKTVEGVLTISVVGFCKLKQESKTLEPADNDHEDDVIILQVD